MNLYKICIKSAGIDVKAISSNFPKISSYEFFHKQKREANRTIISINTIYLLSYRNKFSSLSSNSYSLLIYAKS